MDAQIGERVEVDLDLLRDALEAHVVAGLGVGERVEVAMERARAGDRVAVGAGLRVLEQLDEARLDVVGDHVFPPARLGVDLVPLEADDVD